MEQPKYSLMETERRFLVEQGQLPNVSGVEYSQIVDRYLIGTQLRLRKVTGSKSSKTIHKLCKKYPGASALSQPIVNTYLDSREYAVFASLAANLIVKSRYRLDYAGEMFSLDVFHEDLEGLVMCEVESSDLDRVGQVQLPPWVGVEVTNDIRFSGGQLCESSYAQVCLMFKTL